MKQVKFYCVLIVILFSGCKSVEKLVKVPASAALDSPPLITITALPFLPDKTVPGSAGDIERTEISTDKSPTSEISNIDNGTWIQFYSRASNGLDPKTTGGVKLLTFMIIQDGITKFNGSIPGVEDASGMAPNFLAINKNGNLGITIQIGTTPITVKAHAENFTGGATDLTIMYMPLNPMFREKGPAGGDSNFESGPGQSTYSARFSSPGSPGISV